MRNRKFFIAAIIAGIFCNFFLNGGELELYKKDAIVSYYGDKFQGKPTANGEKYNMNDFTCANKSLPFNTILKVTNLSNNKSVQVRVNDRGPFVSDRELDLSKAAAEKIDMIKSGTAHVRIEIISRGEDTKLSAQTARKSLDMMKEKEKTAAAAKSEKNAEDVKTDSHISEQADYSEMYEIQAGAFKDKTNANHFGNKILDAGIENVVLRKSGDIYRVVIKNISGKELDEVKKKLTSSGFKDFVVKKLKS